MSSVEQRLEVAQGIRRGLMLWPDESRWVQNTYADINSRGETRRCLVQMLLEGLKAGPAGDFSGGFQLAGVAILEAAGQPDVRDFLTPRLCALNNGTRDFVYLKGLVETAATHLEQA